ncbi:MAG TPA: hypothetical protein VGO76_03330 [Luteibacter sp.]|jgi:hypothetical protein|nr:hypothetical protein [Luteibacter sp.]
MKKFTRMVAIALFCLLPMYAVGAIAADGAGRDSTTSGAGLPAPVRGLEGVTCTQKQKGWDAQCVAGEYQIATYPEGCGAEGTYGAIYAKNGASATLYQALSAARGAPVARLKDKQFACVTADARKKHGDVEWYFVTAIPVASVKACAGKTTCQDGSDQPIEWIKPATGEACHRTAAGYTGDCPSGWISAEDFGEFSMGL